MPTFALRADSTESARNLNLHATTAPAECCGYPSEKRCGLAAETTTTPPVATVRASSTYAASTCKREQDCVPPISAAHNLFF